MDREIFTMPCKDPEACEHFIREAHLDLENHKLQSELKACQQENEKLRDVLEVYGCHYTHCKESMIEDTNCSRNPRCICGFDEALNND